VGIRLELPATHEILGKGYKTMLKKSLTFAGLLLAGFAATTAAVQAQGPLYDKVTVDLPYRVTLRDTVLEPGHYVIRQLDSPGGGSRVLQIFTDNGMRLKTSTLTIPALDINTPSSTKVILHHYGNDYYFDKIWIQGKDYGYEFPLPPAVKSREREKMEPYSVAANYEQTKETAADTTTVSSVAPAPAPEPPAAEPAPAPAPVETAQNTPPPAPAVNAAPEMPHTAGNWLGMLLGGGFLSGAGMMVRRIRS
jgi:hypothetical protein